MAMQRMKLGFFNSLMMLTLVQGCALPWLFFGAGGHSLRQLPLLLAMICGAFVSGIVLGGGSKDCHTRVQEGPAIIDWMFTLGAVTALTSSVFTGLAVAFQLHLGWFLPPEIPAGKVFPYALTFALCIFFLLWGFAYLVFLMVFPFCPFIEKLTKWRP